MSETEDLVVLRQASEVLKKTYYSAKNLKDIQVSPDILKIAMAALEEKIMALDPQVPLAPAAVDKVPTSTQDGGETELRIVDPRIESFDVV